ncbi:MAG: type II secretion system protein GspG [bacterium]|nr:type II secretion system protein GspG [bacterium]
MMNKQGFTIVEMLVVLLIIGLLALTIIIVVTGKTTDAKYTQAVADLDAFRSAITMYQIDLGAYPPSGNSNLLKALTHSMSGNANTASPLWKGPYLDINQGRISGDAILDPWENPYNYVTFSDYSTMFDGGIGTALYGAGTSSIPEKYYKFNTYQIFSMGRNTTEYTNNATDLISNAGSDKDDVNNWFGDERNK